MAPKLHTSQIFKGLTYMFVWINNNKFTLVSRSNFLKTRKNYYTPEICKNSKTTPHAWKSQLFTSRSDQMFLCVAGKHAIFLCFTCSSDGPLQITRGLMGYERKQNNGGAKALQILIFLWRSNMELSVTSSYIQKWISPGLIRKMFIKMLNFIVFQWIWKKNLGLKLWVQM